MRTSILALAAVAAVSIFASSGARPAKAEVTYPYCTTQTRWEGSYCRYTSFEQCVAARDVMNATCTPNPSYSAPQSHRSW